MKYAKAHSLRAQQAVAGYGKAVRHPLCLAALDLWRKDAEVSRWTEDLVSIEQVLNSVKQMRETADTPALLRRTINKLLLRVLKHYEGVKIAQAFYQEGRRWVVALFKRERYAALCAGNKGAFRALGRVRKRWSANEADLKDGDHRKLEMLNMLRKRVMEAKWAKGEKGAGYWEALRGGDRALSDEDWQGRLTARQIHSWLVDAGVFSRSVAKERAQLHDIRRLARKLPLRLAEDQPGRKLKPYLRRQEPKQPLGRPRTRPDISFVSDTEAIQASKAAAARGKPQRAGTAALSAN